jgi:hypothetical protein
VQNFWRWFFPAELVIPRREPLVFTNGYKLDEVRMAKGALSIEAFCEKYAVGRTKAYGEIVAGRLKAVKAGKRTLIPEDSAEEWLRSLPALHQAEV